MEHMTRQDGRRKVSGLHQRGAAAVWTSVRQPPLTSFMLPTNKQLLDQTDPISCVVVGLVLFDKRP